jgi:sulfite exporter TauE/SafE
MDAVVGIFLASLAGSPHCAAMCGPLLAFAAAGGDTAASSSRWTLTAGYHGGRLVSYVALGAMAGTLGAGVERIGVLAGVSRLAAIVAGSLMVLWGVDTLLAWRGVRSRLHAPPVMQRVVGRVTRRVADIPSASRATIIGLATALLPCGWLYVFVAAAGATGSPMAAMFVMFVFWTGTLPVMATVGLGLQHLAGPLRRSLPVVTAIVVVVIGLLTIAGRMQPPSDGLAARAHDHAERR